MTATATDKKASSSWLAVFQRIAAMMSERWGIEVVMRGTEAYTDGRRIVVPVVPDDAPPELIAAVQGVLDHEAGHVLFSEFFPIPHPMEKHLVNALEDAREEQRLIALWPGCAVNLRACNDFFCRELDRTGWPVSDFHKLCIALYFAERGLADHWFARKWIDTCAAIQPHLRVALEILRARSVHACASTHEVQALAREILEALRVPRPEPEPEPEPDEPEAGEDEEEASPDEARTADPDGGTTEPARAEPKPAAGRSTASDDTSEREATGAADATEEPGDAHRDPMAVTEAELARDESLSVRRFVAERAREALAASEGRYLVYATDQDHIGPAPARDRDAYRRLVADTRADVATIKRTLARSLLAERKARWEAGLPRGKVNPAALYKVATGVDDRAFRVRRVAPALNTRVSLLVDHSGSMRGSRSALAARAAAVFAEVLAQLRIPFEVLGFTSGPHEDGRRRYYAARPEDRALFARWGALRTIVYQGFAEDYRRASARLPSMATFAEGEANYDGESLLLAAGRLLRAARQGERKVLFVFSDGLPAGTVTSGPLVQRQAAHLHEAVREVRAAGIELFGIGIESEAVKTYYAPTCVVVHKADELPREAMRALDLMLRGRARHAHA